MITFCPESSVFQFFAQNLKIKTHRIIVLAAVFYRCQNVTSREEHTLRVFENRVLRKLFATKRDEETGEWRRLNSEDLTLKSPN